MYVKVRVPGNEYKNIIFNDRFRVRDFKDGELDVIFDIGANIGIFSVFMKMRHPLAKIIAVEPFPDAIKQIKENVHCHGIYLEEKAFGNGDKFYLKEKVNHILDGIYTENGNGIPIESIKLSDLFKLYECKLTDRYLLKFNCEGGEKYLIGDKEAEEILFHAKQVSFQIHYKLGERNFDEWLTLEEYDNWMKKIFTNHIITPYWSKNLEGTIQYTIKRK